jgi:dGTPase
VQEWYLPSADHAALDAALDRLAAEPGWPTSSYDGSRRDLAALKNLTSDLIGRFCRAATEATQEHFGSDPLTRYAADLVVPHGTLLEITVLKGVAAHLVMRAEDRMGLLARQQEVVRELVEALVQGGPGLLEPRFRADLTDASDEAAALRVVVDQVASLTDASALEWHARLCRTGGG